MSFICRHVQRQLSSKEAALPSPPPLRTGHICFQISGSSLSEPPCDRGRHTRYRLHDTGLKPAHVLLAPPPVDGVPLQEVVGDRTSNAHRSHGWFCRHLLCLLSRLRRWSRDERPDGSLPACAWGDVPLRGPPLSGRLQTDICVLRPPLPATLSAGLAARFPRGRATGLPSSPCITQWVRLSLCTGDVVCPCHGTQYPMNPSPFRGMSIWAPALVNDVYREFASASHTIHPSPASRDARRYALASRPQRQPHGCGDIVRGQSTGRYLPASPPRVLMMGHQVRSW